MNIQEYISSGIVESYVLGLASNEERLEFEQLASMHPELRQAREAFEISLEQHALSNAVPPPADLKQRIWNDIQAQSGASPVVNMPSAGSASQPLTPVRSITSKFIAAAAVILLLGSTLLNFYFYSQYKTSVVKLNEYIASNQQLVNNNSSMQTKLQQYENSLDMIKDSNMAVIAMKGQAVAPQGLTTAYWNKQTKDVYLLVNNLPAPAPGKQYQLWAIVDGVPVSAGMLDINAGNMLVKMSNIPKAQAFAITLENTGGAKTPTMPIYTVGKTV